MAGSSSERAIRDAVADRCRVYWPDGRIIHELNILDCRADLAVVTPTHLFTFEIKSEKDKLTRLESQVRAFSAASHECIVVAHEKWFDPIEYVHGYTSIKPGPGLRTTRGAIWCYPERPPHAVYGEDRYSWRSPARIKGARSFADRQPHASKFLSVLWKEELLTEARRHGIAVLTSWNMAKIISAMAMDMTGRQIAHAVCRQLRSRPFAEADPAIFEVKP